MIRAAVVSAAVFAMAALFYMEFRQALLLAALAGATALVLEKVKR
jgi:hypothetical protein